MNGVRSLDLKLLRLLIIHYIIIQVFFCYITLFEIPDPSFYSEKQTRNRHKNKDIFLARWINKHKKRRINPTAEDHHSCFCVKLRMAC